MRSVANAELMPVKPVASYLNPTGAPISYGASQNLMRRNIMAAPSWLGPTQPSPAQFAQGGLYLGRNDTGVPSWLNPAQRPITLGGGGYAQPDILRTVGHKGYAPNELPPGDGTYSWLNPGQRPVQPWNPVGGGAINPANQLPAPQRPS